MNLQDKKILVFDKFLGYDVGGAQRSLHKLLANLGYNFRFLGCNTKKTYHATKFANVAWKIDRIDMIEVARFPYFEYWLNRAKIRREITKSRDSVLITQGLFGAVAARFFSGKIIYLIRDEYQLNRVPLYQRGINKIFKIFYLLLQLPFILLMFSDNRRAIRNADVVVANSKYIKEEIKKKFNKNAIVIYPVIDVGYLETESGRANFKKDFITCIGSEYMKGRKIVEHIAQEMLDHQFMIVGREFRFKFKKGNITYLPWSNDVLDIYRYTKILLVPSICAEALGRVVIEAKVLKIPAISSGRGGLSEVTDKDLVVQDVFNTKDWVDKILDVERNYPEYSSADRPSFAQFDCDIQVGLFDNVIKNII